MKLGTSIYISKSVDGEDAYQGSEENKFRP
jgi:hypothetical protein